MKLHALVSDYDTAHGAVEGGATVVQLRVKDLPTHELVERGRAMRSLCARHGVTFVVNDDVEAALLLGADGVHLGRNDDGQERARELGLLLGLSASSVDEARAAETRGAAYIGAGPVWPTLTKPDAGVPIGLVGLTAIAKAVSVPVIAIGGVNPINAAACIEAGAAGVAVVRTATEARALRAAVDAAL